jgi:hypothetical protein
MISMLRVACAVVLVSACAACAGPGDKSSAVHVGAPVPDTATTGTSQSTSTTGASAPVTSTSADPTPTTATPAPPAVQPVEPGDIEGTISFATPTMHLGETTPFTFTIKNVSDHPISVLKLPDGTSRLEVDLSPLHYIDPAAISSVEELPSLDPGATHVFSLVAGLDGEGRLVGPARAVARIRHTTGTPPDEYSDAEDLVGVAPVAITVLPAGWSAGQPLQPIQAQWTAHMSTDTAVVSDDGTVMVHASVRNVSADPALTRGIGSLAIACGRSVGGPFIDHVVDQATLAPGAAQSFSFELSLPNVFAYTAESRRYLSHIECSLGMKFEEQQDPYNFPAFPYWTIDSDAVAITVTHAGATTTTTTTVATSP